MDQDEVKIIDTPIGDQRKEEHKDKQPIVVAGWEAQSDDMVEEEARINVVLLVHDEASGDPRVEVNLPIPEHDIALAGLIATYSMESK